MFRRITIFQRRFGITSVNNNKICIQQERRSLVTSSEKYKKDKEDDKGPNDYLERMMDEEQKAQRTSERVNPDYWRDPGSLEKEDHEGHSKNPQENKQSKSSSRKR
ncbi:hypothetical protein INT45_012573 [Circinella minor]|uniref:Uncharacterized protein n=1 Tax=Circinella minor TaxID=1195481 RepID=A0A8H7RZE7_9FUNG|nr:hypothetical protein INT45_012573 [Circinella minor]